MAVKKKKTIDDLDSMAGKNFQQTDGVKNKLDNAACRFELAELEKQVRISKRKVK